MSENDIFISNTIYPDAKSIFSISGKPVKSVMSNCLFVLDTNALLLPYTVSPKSIDEIKRVYTKIIGENRLIIPGQVAREFANNRPEKIKEIFSQFTRKRSKINELKIGKYPLLEGVKGYQELIEHQAKLDEQLLEYSKKIKEVISEIKNWTWNDPISEVYNSLFVGDVVVDLTLDKDRIKKELEVRYHHKIPPGYKDGHKPDDGIGDLLIWFTILELAKTKNQDIVFVSGEEKTDWFHKSESQTLYPRFELITEFRTYAPDKSFNIIKLSEMLELFGADDVVVKELEDEEKDQVVSEFRLGNSVGQRVNPIRIAYRWLTDNMDGYNVNFYSNGRFPDLVLIDNQEKMTPVNVMYIQHNSFASNNVEMVLETSGRYAKELGYEKILLFIILDFGETMDFLLQNISDARSSTKVSDIDIEVIVGYTNKRNQFVKIY